MKLVHYTYRQLATLLLLFMGVWGVLFYYAILEEVMDETDDMLENYSQIIIQSALKDPSILHTQGGLMSRYVFRPISEEVAANYQHTFWDATVYLEIEDENDPVRVLASCFMMPNGQFYELQVMSSVLERDDMVEAILWYLGVLYLLLILCTAVGIRVVLKQAFRPLHHLLHWIERIRPGKEVPAFTHHTHIVEFQQLTDAAVAMSNRSYKAYQEQKQFIENASHELQTPIAIARAKVELLAESDSLNEEQMNELDQVYNTLGRVVKLNKSLLLLSRIENGQYTETEKVSLNHIVDTLLPHLMEVYQWKQIRISCKDEGAFTINCNPSLAHILVSNLLNNALAHTQDTGEMQVILTTTSFEVRNSGVCSLDSEMIFQRFYRATDKKESTGLGLAIAKSIATSYKLLLTYTWVDQEHVFKISK